MSRQAVTQFLNELAVDGIPEDVDLWPDIKTQVQTYKKTSRWFKLVPAGWPKRTSLVLLLLLAFSTIAYAATGLGNNLIQHDPGMRYIEQIGLLQEVNLNQTVDDVVVSLHQVYADANRVVVSFVVSGRFYLRYVIHDVSMSDQFGNVYNPMIMMMDPEISGTQDLSVPKANAEYVIYFVTPPMEEYPTQLLLHLSIELKEYFLVVPVRKHTSIGPYEFEFEAQFHRGEVIEVSQVATAGEISITLERVIITPSAAQAIFCCDVPRVKCKTLAPIASFENERGVWHSGITSSVSSIGGKSCFRDFFFPQASHQPNKWSLTVTELVCMEFGPSNEQVRFLGPWKFQLQDP
jgi:hypothetical protein